ncbi:HAMP domain-containing sensor histidine kinase [Lactococcus hodotermopsidis]|nr:HAMP domain-containing histidine kinase [Lactococcus hodotermopsidis]
MLFCFLVFTVFVTISYRLSAYLFLKEEKDNLVMVVNTVADNLSDSTEELTSINIHRYLNYKEPNVLVPWYDNDGNEIKSAEGIGIPGIFRRIFQIYDVSGNMIFTTKMASLPLSDERSVKPKLMMFGGEMGYIVTREIKSKKTGQIVGYLQSFNELKYFYSVRNRLLTLLIMLEILALVFATIIGYLMSNHFLKPLAKLHAAMSKTTTLPSDEFEKVDIDSGDEVEELADVYNDMMSQTQDYINGQKRFVSDVSHELRTPLAVLEGHINLLRRWGKDDPQQLVESLDASYQEVKKMSSMIRDMLAISHLQHSEDYKFEKTDLVASVEELVEDFRMLNQTFRIEFESFFVGYKAYAQIYKNHYEQALTILLDNAVKYAGDNEKYIKVTLKSDEKNIITTVSDHGLGINAEDLPHVFERFFRADKARNREIGGTGLGLSIILTIAKIYDGSVSVTSEVGKGSEFSFSVPKAT